MTSSEPVLFPVLLSPDTGSTVRRNRHAPYLYTDPQIAMLILGAKQLAPTVWCQTMATLNGLMAATGIRTSEAVGLDTTSLDV